jgi:N,N-dimethylformamidase
VHVGGRLDFLSSDVSQRADMAFFRPTNGGAILSTRSIAFGQALPYANDISRFLSNVVDAFTSWDRCRRRCWPLEEKTMVKCVLPSQDWGG